MNIDLLPFHHWNFLFQVQVMITIGLVMVQVVYGDLLDRTRYNGTSRWLFHIRRGAVFAKLLALCWLVVYAHQRSWIVWPPVVAFLLAFNVRIVTDILVMREDVKKFAETT